VKKLDLRKMALSIAAPINCKENKPLKNPKASAGLILFMKI
jgi:hypothetical protein